jgi:hypothetical protein
MTENAAPRELNVIAADIIRSWPKPYFGAVPYIQAMRTMKTMKDMYYADDAFYIVRYLLGNMQTFRGADARRLKAELKALVGDK